MKSYKFNHTTLYSPRIVSFFLSVFNLDICFYSLIFSLRWYTFISFFVQLLRGCVMCSLCTKEYHNASLTQNTTAHVTFTFWTLISCSCSSVVSVSFFIFYLFVLLPVLATLFKIYPARVPLNSAAEKKSGTFCCMAFLYTVVWSK